MSAGVDNRPPSNGDVDVSLSVGHAGMAAGKESEGARRLPGSPQIGAGYFGKDTAQRRAFMSEARAGSTPPGSAKLPAGASNAKAIQESAILTAVRRQMEALEDKLGSQITRVQQQGDRMRDVALSRVDTKVGSMETLQPQFDRKLAELRGNYKGISDELQAQIRRIDQMDTRVGQRIQKYEEELDGKFAEIDQNCQQLSSSFRIGCVTNDDLLKRLNKRVLRLEGIHDERATRSEEVDQSLVNMHDRLSQLEELGNAEPLCGRGDALPLAVHDRSPELVDAQLAHSGHSVPLKDLDARLQDVCCKVEMMRNEVHDNHAKIEASEERLKSLRTLLETKEEHHRWLHERIERADWEPKFRDVWQHLHELGKNKAEHLEKMDVVHKRLDGHEQLHDEMIDSFRKVQDRDGPLALSSTASTIMDPGDAVVSDVRECVVRLGHSEARITFLVDELKAVRADMQLAPRVVALVDQLKELAPKVINQENSIRDLHEKMGKIAATGRLQGSPQDGEQLSGGRDVDSGVARGIGALGAALGARLGRLEAEMKRLARQVEGGDVQGMRDQDEDMHADEVRDD